MDAFLEAYVEAALWSSTDPDNNDKPLDADYGFYDLAPETLAAMKADCEKFVEQAGMLIDSDDAAKAGHDFWLTRNGHGCGFWDGDWGEELGELLTKICDGFHEVNLYVWEGKVFAS